MMWLNLFDPLEFKVSNILLSTSEFYECDHLTMCDEIKTFSTGLTNLRCLLFQVWGHWPRCLGNKMTIFILVQSKTLWLWLVVCVCLCVSTCENTIDTLGHYFCVVHTEAHGRFKLHHAFPGSICTDTDSIFLFQPTPQFKDHYWRRDKFPDSWYSLLELRHGLFILPFYH